jgi:hypothetical protein
MESEAVNEPLASYGQSVNFDQVWKWLCSFFTCRGFQRLNGREAGIFCDQSHRQ